MPLSRLLLRGLLAGLIAGLLAGGFAFVFGEPHIDAAIAIEEAAADVSGDAGHHEDPVVSRDGQKAGLVLATTLYGIAVGGILAVAFALLRRHLRTGSDSRAALWLAGSALLGAVLVPFLKYPPNPPAVGDPDTITQRTWSYLAVLVLGLVAVWAAVIAARTQQVEWRRAGAAVLGFLVVVTVAYLLLPDISEVPETFPPALLWDFRITSLGVQAVLWTALGLSYAALLSPSRTTTPAAEKVAA